MRTVIFLLAYTGTLAAQSLTVTAPSASQSISGVFTFAGTCTSCSSLYSVGYFVDDQPAGQSVQPPVWQATGRATSPGSNLAFIQSGYRLLWDSQNSVWNGWHRVYAVAYTALGAVIATSPVVAFQVANNLVDFTPTTRTNLFFTVTDPNNANTLGQNAPSTWSGTVTIPYSITGASSTELTNGIAIGTVIDGIGATNTVHAATGSVTLNTAQVLNGVRPISIWAAYYSGPNPMFYGQWMANVTVANGIANVELLNGAREVFLNNNQTYQLNPLILRADGSTTAASGATYSVINNTDATQCTVSAAGLITAQNGPGGCQIQVSATGLTRNTWVYVGLSSVYHFYKNGTINAAYSAASSIFLSSTFQSSQGFPMADIDPSGSSFPGDTQWSGMPAYYTAAGRNSYETGIVGTGPGVSQSSYISGLTTTISNASGIFNKYGLFGVLIGDPLTRGASYIYNITRGPCSTWTPNCITDTYTRWGATGKTPATVMSDEANGFLGSAPIYAGQLYLGATGAPTSMSVKVQQTTSSTNYTLSSNDCGRWVTFTGSGTTVNFPSGGLGGAGGVCNIHLNNQTGAALTLNSVFAYAQLPAGQTNVFQYTGTGWVRATNPVNYTPCNLGTFQWPNGTFGHAGYSYNDGINSFTNSVAAGMIYGSSDSNINTAAGGYIYLFYNPGNGQSGGDPNYWEFPVISTFPADKTYTSSSDAGLYLEPQATAWCNPSTGACSGPTGGGGYTDYVHWNAISNIISNTAAANVNVNNTWAVTGGAPNVTVKTYMSSPWSQFTSFYFFSNIQNFSPLRQSFRAWSTEAGASFMPVIRAREQIVGTEPYGILTEGVSINYKLSSLPPLTLTSCNNETFTFSSPHGLATIVPGFTRMLVSGSSGGSCDGEYYIDQAPTPTTVKASLAAATFSFTPTSGSPAPTLKFEQSGAQYTLRSGTSAFAVSNTLGATGNINTIPACATLSHLGETFGISGSDSPNVNAARYVFAPDASYTAYGVVAPCSALTFRQLPSGSSTGGTAYMFPDAWYHPGASFTNGSYAGPDLVFFARIAAGMMGGAADRLYGFSNQSMINDSPNGWEAGAAYNRTIFGTQLSTSVAYQSGEDPRYDAADSTREWYASGMANRFDQRFIQYRYQSRATVADYGQDIESALTQGSSGNLLMLMNVSDSTQNRTVDLSTCMTFSGQQGIKYVFNWRGGTISTINAGVTSDSLTLPFGYTVRYLCPSVYAGTLQQPTVSVNLADVSGASSVAIRFGYDQYSLDAVTSQTTNCGTAVSCTLPVDQAIGPIYYRILYLNPLGAPIAQSGVQTL